MLAYLRQWLTEIRSALVDRPLTQGTVLKERYQVIKLLGMGSYGMSYLCLDLQLGTDCVVKQVKPSLRKSEKGLQSYEYETDILNRLRHPAIPAFYERFTHLDHLFYAMEYIPGGNLEDLIFEDQRKFTEREAVELLLQLVEITAYLHEHQLIHRDIRIPNLILYHGQLKLIDFGLARSLQAPEENIADHMIEKQLRRQIDVKSDFYAMGHVLLFLLYSNYTAEDEKERSWEEELDLFPITKSILCKLLQIDLPYQEIQELKSDLKHLLTYL
ncbi:serine/threonine protein kinase [Ammoniphilus sp. 3BR4]|uniref:serine/threonine protein kinase n=1 Tax=Ammoniphilus sp. 3BR4 TaxID=3158265 RepID=UPI00346643EF